MQYKIILADENQLFRLGLKALLSAHPDFMVVADLQDIKNVLHETIKLQPDIVMMDLRALGAAGLGMVEQIKRRYLPVNVILLTSLRIEEYVRAALSAGVDGYILKDASFEELLMALHSVAIGKKYLSPDVSGYVVESFLHPDTVQGKRKAINLLSDRERGVLQLIAEGRTNRSAAEFLCVSSKTVEKHRSNMMQKLGLRNAAELTLVAIEMGLIERPMSVSRLLGVSPSGFASLD